MAQEISDTALGLSYLYCLRGSQIDLGVGYPKKSKEKLAFGPVPDI